jgi:putative GTP pyrophosphokinase
VTDRKTARFRDFYKRYREEVLEPTRSDIREELRSWKRPRRWKPHRGKEDETVPTPIQRTRVRIKRLESIEDKIARNPHSYPSGLTSRSLKSMHDLVGARIIIYFVTDLPLIDRELSRAPEIELDPSRPPKAYLPQRFFQELGMTDILREDKESGYASVHYQCRLTGDSPIKRPSFELQVRSLAEDVWGEIEHILGYKPGKTTALPVSREFQILSKQIGAIDEQFALLYHRQRIHRETINISPEHPPNAENIPRVLAEMGLPVAQDEVNGLLRIMASRGIKEIGELEARGTAERVQMIRKRWHETTNQVAQTFDVIAVLGTIGVDADVAQVHRKTDEWATVALEWGKRVAEDGLLEE